MVQNTSTSTETDGQPDGGSARRTVLKSVALAGALAGTGNAVAATGGDNETDGDGGDDGDERETIVLGGKVEYWLGVAPEPIEGEENPALELEEDQDYEIVWINMDGEPHVVSLLDENEEELETAGETVEEIGETQRLEFTATEEMTTYICTVHPETQVGDVELGEGFEDGDG